MLSMKIFFWRLENRLKSDGTKPNVIESLKAWSNSVSVNSKRICILREFRQPPLHHFTWYNSRTKIQQHRSTCQTSNVVQGNGLCPLRSPDLTHGVPLTQPSLLSFESSKKNPVCLCFTLVWLQYRYEETSHYIRN